MEKRAIDIDCLKKHVPGWEDCPPVAELQIQRLPGLSNYTMKVANNGSIIIYRIFANYFSILLNRDFETKLLKLVEPLIYCPRVLHSEETFRIEQYLPLASVTSKGILGDLRKMKMLMYRIAEIHGLSNNKEFNSFLSSEKVDRKPRIKQALDSVSLKALVEERVEVVPAASSEEERKAREEVRLLWKNEITSSEFQRKMHGLISKLDELDHVKFCHNDLNNGNFLLDEAKGNFFILDYEFAGFNYRGYDIANFFNEMTMEYDYPAAPFFKANPELYPKEKTLKEVLAHYLLADKFLEGLDKEEKIQKEREHLDKDYDEVRALFETAGHLEWFEKEIKSLGEEIKYAQALGHYFWMNIAYLSLDFEDLHFDMASYIKLKHSEILRILGEL